MTESSEKESKNTVCQHNVGTAFTFDGMSHFLTMKSIVDKAGKVQIVNIKGEKFNARVIGDDETGTISILEIDKSYSPILPKISKLNSLQAGDNVLFMAIVSDKSLKTTFGVVDKIYGTDGIIQVSAPNTPGTSGTPVFDVHGNVVGLLAFKIESDNSLSSTPVIKEKLNKFLVLSLEYASVFARSVITQHAPTSSWIGLSVFLHSDVQQGVTIKDVARNSPAELSGLQPGDIIIEFNGSPIETPACLGAALSQTKVGDVVPIKFNRNNLITTVNVTLEECPEKR
jgi:serine protease Do